MKRAVLNIRASKNISGLVKVSVTSPAGLVKFFLNVEPCIATTPLSFESLNVRKKKLDFFRFYCYLVFLCQEPFALCPCYLKNKPIDIKSANAVEMGIRNYLLNLYNYKLSALTSINVQIYFCCENIR